MPFLEHLKRATDYGALAIKLHYPEFRTVFTLALNTIRFIMFVRQAQGF